MAEEWRLPCLTLPVGVGVGYQYTGDEYQTESTLFPNSEPRMHHSVVATIPEVGLAYTPLQITQKAAFGLKIDFRPVYGNSLFQIREPSKEGIESLKERIESKSTFALETAVAVASQIKVAPKQQVEIAPGINGQWNIPTDFGIGVESLILSAELGVRYIQWVDSAFAWNIGIRLALPFYSIDSLGKEGEEESSNEVQRVPSTPNGFSTFLTFGTVFQLF